MLVWHRILGETMAVLVGFHVAFGVAEWSTGKGGVLGALRDLTGRSPYMAGAAVGAALTDPAGFAKGWITERAATRLDDAGLADWYVGAGGDVVTRGRPAPDRPWRDGRVGHQIHRVPGDRRRSRWHDLGERRPAPPVRMAGCC